jgi:hypothetical protein
MVIYKCLMYLLHDTIHYSYLLVQYFVLENLLNLNNFQELLHALLKLRFYYVNSTFRVDSATYVLRIFGLVFSSMYNAQYTTYIVQYTSAMCMWGKWEGEPAPLPSTRDPMQLYSTCPVL